MVIVRSVSTTCFLIQILTDTVDRETEGIRWQREDLHIDNNQAL